MRIGSESKLRINGGNGPNCVKPSCPTKHSRRPAVPSIIERGPATRNLREGGTSQADGGTSCGSGEESGGAPPAAHGDELEPFKPLKVNRCANRSLKPIAGVSDSVINAQRLLPLASTTENPVSKSRKLRNCAPLNCIKENHFLWNAHIVVSRF